MGSPVGSGGEQEAKVECQVHDGLCTHQASTGLAHSASRQSRRATAAAAASAAVVRGWVPGSGVVPVAAGVVGAGAVAIVFMPPLSVPQARVDQCRRSLPPRALRHLVGIAQEAPGIDR